jgi:hypothetical protein
MNALLQRHTPARLVKIMIARKGIELGRAREDLAQPNGRAAMNGRYQEGVGVRPLRLSPCLPVPLMPSARIDFFRPNAST